MPPEPPQERLTLPRLAETAPRHPFPLLGSVAPVVGAIVIWAITASPFALVFAALGPIVAVAGVADARLQARRRARRERARLAAESLDLVSAIEAAHARERARLERASPPVLALLDVAARDPGRWRGDPERELAVRIGRADRPSTLRLDGDRTGFDELVRQATTLVDAPLVVDARLGIGIYGPSAIAGSLARSISLQIAAALPPESTTWSAQDPGWLHALPHRPDPARATVHEDVHEHGHEHGRERHLTWHGEGGAVIVAVASEPGGLPHECRVIVGVTRGGAATLVAHPDVVEPLRLSADFVSVEQALEVATRLADVAGRRAGGVLPARVPFGTLEQQAPVGLSATFMVGERGPIPIDLVSDGPHAVVAGTTGSGKSELLLAWLLGMASERAPDEVNFLLVDFKGGASFGPVADLPHVVGLVTDLDERAAHRALASLRAEVRFREARLAAATVRSIEELPLGSALPRLVIVVDEFAALVGGFDELHDLFADLAARGRSLGMHLILCTQRPAGVVRDSVLANVPLRLSLRVNSRADSAAVIGSDDAANLPPDPPGRAMVALAGADPVAVQIALASADDCLRVVERWAGSPSPRRPWCDELPGRLDLAQLHGWGAATEGLCLGLMDLPEEQRQAVATWNPAVDRNLLILGAAGAGKSAMLDLIAQDARARRVPGGFCAAWDAVAAGLEDIRRGVPSQYFILLDDIDAVAAYHDDEYAHVFTDMLVELLRTGSAVGITVVLTARRVTPSLQAIAASCDSRLLLRLQDRQDVLLAGGDPALHSPGAPAGRGQWKGVALQVAFVEPGPTVARTTTKAFRPGSATMVVVSGRPAALARVLEARGKVVELGFGSSTELVAESPCIIVGDPDAWQANWGTLAALRQVSPVLFDRCVLGTVRAITGQRALPPPIDQHAGEAWLLQPGEGFSRVTLD